MTNPVPETIEFLGKTLSGAFTIPSGIVATAVPIIEYFFRHAPQIGVMTTKSIGPEPRLGNREPILSQYAPGCFVNAVGLTNPGAARSAELFKQLEVPDDRFLLTSIFGGSVEEFVAVAQLLAPTPTAWNSICLVPMPRAMAWPWARIPSLSLRLPQL